MEWQCPKDKNVILVDGFLADDLAVKCCPDCKGTWIPTEQYQAWKYRQPQREVDAAYLATGVDVDYVPSSYDTKAGLCPECKRYLSRSKVRLKTPFYVERCPNCGGIWCDYGEWEVLEQLGLENTIEQLFSGEWQSSMRAVQQAEKEKQATIEKLGPEVAQMLFELAEILEGHPNGDFGVAYLMRRFDKPQ